MSTAERSAELVANRRDRTPVPNDPDGLHVHLLVALGDSDEGPGRHPLAPYLPAWSSPVISDWSERGELFHPSTQGPGSQVELCGGLHCVPPVALESLVDVLDGLLVPGSHPGSELVRLPLRAYMWFTKRTRGIHSNP